MSTQPPDWYEEWVPIRSALSALGKAARTTSRRTREKRLREFAHHGGWLTAEDSLDRVYAAGAAATEALRALYENLDLPVQDDEPAEQAVEIWYLRSCLGRSTSEIAQQLHQSESWVKERSGTGSTVKGAWEGVARVSAAVQAAVLTALDQEPKVGDSAVVRYILSRLSDRERTLACLISLMTPGVDVARPLEQLQRAWHVSYPPVRDVMQEPRKLMPTLSKLVAVGLVQRTDHDLTMSSLNCAAIRAWCTPAQLQDFAGQLIILLAATVDSDDWQPWAPFIPHVETVCEAAIESSTALKEACLLLDGLSQYQREHERLGEAERLSRRAVAVGEKRFGRRHPEVARLKANLAKALMFREDYPAARKVFDQAVRILERHAGEGLRLAGVLTMRAGALASLGEQRLAEEDFQRVLSMYERYPDVDRYLLEAYNDYATLLEEDGRYAEALDYYNRVRERAGEKFPGPEATLHAGLLLLELKQWVQALDALLEAERLLKSPQKELGGCGPDDRDLLWHIWKVHEALGDTYVALGDERNASKYHQIALEINDKAIVMGIGEDIKEP